MDAIIVVPLIIILLVAKYHFTDHDTKSDKERKRFAEGIALFEDKNYAGAFTFFNKILAEDRKSAIAFSYRGKCQLLEENLHGAIYDFTQALSFDNTLADVHFDKGKAHYELGEFKEAFLCFDKAIWFSRGENKEAFQWRSWTEDRMEKQESNIKDIADRFF